MQKSLLLFITILFLNIFQTNASNNIIQSIDVEPNYNYEGVKGINITYRYNFLSLEEEHHNDTLLRGCTFTIKTTLFENSNAIKPAIGYTSLINESDNLEFTITLTGSEVEASKFHKNATQFIPYAALKLTEGKHIISINAEITGKDATGFLHEYEKIKEDVEFKKPATKIFTMNIDYVEVNTSNSNGGAWDFAIYKMDAPDVGITILIGNTTVWKSNVNDTYMFAVGPNSENITFTISEKDKVAVLVQDIDVIFHDFVAKWIFTTADKKDGMIYTYDKTKGNIKSCNLNFKID